MGIKMKTFYADFKSFDKIHPQKLNVEILDHSNKSKKHVRKKI
jgi:hypothetical protein